MTAVVAGGPRAVGFMELNIGPAPLRRHYRRADAVTTNFARMLGRTPGGAHQYLLRLKEDFPRAIRAHTEARAWGRLAVFVGPTEVALGAARPVQLDLPLLSASHTAYADCWTAGMRYFLRRNRDTAEIFARLVALVIGKMQAMLGAVCAEWGLLP